jgi:transcription elongation GreA/GreB family factor
VSCNGRQRTATAPRTPTTFTASGACAKSTGGSAFLTRRLDLAEIVDPARRENTEQVFFGATVTLCDEQGMENTYQIVGVDETDSARGRISWVSPLARALLKSRAGDAVRFQSPAGWRVVEVLAVEYPGSEHLSPFRRQVGRA